jgi:phage terminase large subunit
MQSSKRMIETKIQSLGVGSSFQVLHDRIITPGGGLVILVGMQDATAESIKSLEGFRIAWIEEAQTLSARSLSLLRPTIRAEGSQIWASWNPRRKSDAVDDFLRARKPDNAIVPRTGIRLVLKLRRQFWVYGSQLRGAARPQILKRLAPGSETSWVALVGVI